MLHKVTVIIPAYNAAEFLHEAIDSALGQTYREFEVIVIDDGSSDKTEDIALSYGSKINFIKTSNQGVAKARNTGIEAATGEFVAFLDSDDIWESNKLERQIMAVEEGYRFVYTDTVSFGLNAMSELHISAGEPLPSGMILQQLVERNFIATSSVLLDRELAIRIGGFDPKIPIVDDWDMWLRVSNQTAARAISEPLVHYRVRTGSLGSNLETRISESEKVIESGLNMLSLSTAKKTRIRKQALAECIAYAALLAETDGNLKPALDLRLRALKQRPSYRNFKDYVKTMLARYQ